MDHHLSFISGMQEKTSPLILGTTFHEVTLNMSSATLRGSYSVKTIDFPSTSGRSAEEVKGNDNDGTFNNTASAKQFDGMPSR